MSSPGASAVLLLSGSLGAGQFRQHNAGLRSEFFLPRAFSTKFSVFLNDRILKSRQVFGDPVNVARF